MSEAQDDAYERGHIAGEIAARLAGHDRHFQAINGSIADVATALHELSLQVQRLGDQAVARDATVVTTAAALKDAEEARRDKTEQSWSPMARLLAGTGALSAALGTIVAIYLATRK